MASSSSVASPASAPYPCYDVFLNHRGPDVKATFAKDLYHRLTCCGLRVFLDDPEMRAGSYISQQIEAAIGVASVHVAIFSPCYAESKWCLEELALMVASMKSRAAVILPVFYNVSPGDLQYGKYAEQLSNHENKKRHDLQTIQKWRDALHCVKEISGFDLNAFNGNKEEALLEKVVQTVLERVPKPLLDVAKFPTGLEEKMQELQTTVPLHKEGRPEAKVVGIVGAGGIGKTTLAKEYFNRHRSEYGPSSFLFDVRENAARKSLHSLQIKLIEDLKGVTIKIERWDEGKGHFEKHLSGCQVLVILDDVDHLHQLDAFLPIKDVVHPKSLILVTSRDKGLLIRAGIAESSIYHLRGLNRIHSRQLFCSHAFSQLDPPSKYEKLVDGFLQACDGLPLSLKVFGALLYRQDDQLYWEGVLSGLNKTLDADIQKTLKISYDSLSEEEKQIFLDIACFAIGEDKDKWIKIWNGSGWQGLVGFRNLQYKCLVEVHMPPLELGMPDFLPPVTSFDFSAADFLPPVTSFDFSADIFCKDKKIRMHDHLRDLGRHIADTEAHSHRVWNSGERLRDLLEESPSVNPEVRGICSKELLSLNEAQVSRIRKLQLMDTKGHYVERILPSVSSPKLVWLRWKECPFDSLPSWIPMRDLRVLEVSGGRLERLWEEQQAPLQLEELIIDAPLLEFPKSIGQLKHLQKIVLQNAVLQNFLLCPQLPSGLLEDFVLRPQQQRALLRTALPEEFYDLRSLKYLIVENCTKFTGFGDLAKLTNLQHICLQGCQDFKDLPKSLANLSNLQYLSLRSCKSLNYLPDSLGNLSNLQFLRLSHCENLKMLPDSLWNLRNLLCLHIEECPKLETLPGSSKMLSTNIQEINLGGCRSLKMLPDSLGSLTNLRHIDLTTCASLEMLPDSFGNLTNLLDIRLFGCESLKRIPNSLRNVNLQLINLHYCASLEMLPDSFGNLTSLQRIDLRWCRSLEMLPESFGNLTSLQEIDLSMCTRLKMLPESFGNLTSLQKIDLRDCPSLNYLPDSLGNLSNLQFLRLSHCENLKMLPDSLWNLRNLLCLHIKECPKLETLPGSSKMLSTNIQEINLSGCSCLEMLPDSFGNLTSLQKIDLSGCTRLKMLPESFGNLTSLEGINLAACENLKMLPTSFWNLSRLEHLHLNLSLIISSETLGNIITLEWFEDEWSYREGEDYCLQMDPLLPRVARPPWLERMALQGANLKESPNDIAGLSNLEYMRLRSPSLEVLPPSFGYLKSLQELCLYGCEKLQCLPESIGLLTQLTELWIGECGIQYLPPAVMKLNNLEKLTIWRCPLRELPFKKEDEGGEGDTALLPESSRAKRVKLNELDSSAEKGMMVNLKELCLFKTEIREISFPEGVCPNLRLLDISCCSDLVEVGALPVTLEVMELISCNALRKIGGLDGLVELHRLRIKGCPIEVDELLLPAQTLKYEYLVPFGDISKEERDAELEEWDAKDNIWHGMPSRRCEIWDWEW